MQQMSVQQLKSRLQTAGCALLLLDVREPWEVQLCGLAQAKCIPMGQIPARLSELDKECDIVVMCHHGTRSQYVAQFLAGHGFKKLFNLTGGIDAWAREIEPTMATY